MLQLRYSSPVSRQHLPPPMPPPTFHQQPHYREELPLNGFAFPGSPDPAWPPAGQEQSFRPLSSTSVLPGQWPDYGSPVPSRHCHRSPNRQPALQQLGDLSACQVGMVTTTGSPTSAPAATAAAAVAPAALELQRGPAAVLAPPGSGTSSPAKRKRTASGTGQPGSASSSRGCKISPKPSRSVLLLAGAIRCTNQSVCAVSVRFSRSWSPALIEADPHCIHQVCRAQPTGRCRRGRRSRARSSWLWHHLSL